MRAWTINTFKCRTLNCMSWMTYSGAIVEPLWYASHEVWQVDTGYTPEGTDREKTSWSRDHPGFVENRYTETEQF